MAATSGEESSTTVGSVTGRQYDLRALADPLFQFYRRSFPPSTPTRDGEQVPRSAVTTLAAVASSIKRGAEGMGRWGLSELTLGLYKLSQRHAAEGAEDAIGGTPVNNRGELETLLSWLYIANAAYERDKQGVSKISTLSEEQIVKVSLISSVHKPAYYLAVDHSKRCVILCVRGTWTATDVLTDMSLASEPFTGPSHSDGGRSGQLDSPAAGISGYAHHGMLEAAKWLAENESKNLRALLTRHQGYDLVLCGHSLGAGTAALLAMLLHGWNGSADSQTRLGVPSSVIRAVLFAAPPVVSRQLAEAATSFVTTVVLQDDVIARVCPATLEDLRGEILATDWSHVLKEGEMKTKVVAALASTRDTLHPHVKAAEKAAGLKEGALASAGSSIAKIVFAKGAARAIGPRVSKGFGYLGTAAAIAAAVGGSVYDSMAAAGDPPRQASASEAGPSDGATAPASNGGAASGEVARSGSGGAVPVSAEEAERRRLFVPGLQYHIVRRPAIVGTEKKDERNGKGAEEGVGEGSEKVRHSLFRGDDPSRRFGRIVLTNTMLADHSCPAYAEGLQDALRTCV
ncbi:hypothetical protein KFL_001140140 [Klebsormidium nitens]|uniref:Fungal lipase-type domain-containing protein n=1 Tax=Klebsormidium nitens TaxID=105231 RepID=A0A1Y1I176_KLENI|nr:hypothetical protein KFL_001140140 [Klebsormidium nitens]|eukprot:GAQ82526.1 hypothetical protein KFL_001140140 [Klebsormidium nitens]